jgi:hypothetical protein
MSDKNTNEKNSVIRDLVAQANEKQLASFQDAKIKKALDLADPQAKELKTLAILERVAISSDSRVMEAKARQTVASMLFKAQAVNSLSEQQRTQIKNSKKALQEEKQAKPAKVSKAGNSPEVVKDSSIQ